MESKQAEVAQITMYVTFAEMAILIVALSITLTIVLKQMKFKFPVILLLLLIVADMSSFILAWGLEAEGTDFHKEHTVLLA